MKCIIIASFLINLVLATVICNCNCQGGSVVVTRGATDVNGCDQACQTLPSCPGNGVYRGNYIIWTGIWTPVSIGRSKCDINQLCCFSGNLNFTDSGPNTILIGTSSLNMMGSCQFDNTVELTFLGNGAIANPVSLTAKYKPRNTVGGVIMKYSSSTGLATKSIGVTDDIYDQEYYCSSGECLQNVGAQNPQTSDAIDRYKKTSVKAILIVSILSIVIFTACLK